MPDVGLEIKAAYEAFHEDEASLTELLAGPHGAVALDLAQRAIAVESTAKQYASGRPGPNVVTGRLRSSITWRLGVDELGVYADIGTAVYYAIFLELGTINMPAYPFLVPALNAANA